MACFGLEFIKMVLIWLVIIGAMVAFVRLILPLILPPLGSAGNIVVQALMILLWAVVAIVIIVFVFDLLSCLLGWGGGGRLLR